MVLVAGSEDWSSTSRLPQILDAAGCCVHTLGNPNFGFAKTRFSHRHFAVGGGPEIVARALIARYSAAAASYRHTIVADDGLLAAVLAKREEAAARALLPVRSETALNLIADKYLLLSAVAEANVATPASIFARGPRDLEAAAESIGYPLVLKDANGAGDAGGTGVRRVDTPAELAAAKNAGSQTGALIVQRFVEGRLGCTQVLFDRGLARLSSSFYARDCFPTKFGPSTVRESADHLDVASVARALGELTGFHGLCGFDWIEDDAGRLFFLEFNARPIYLEATLRRAFAAALAHMLGTSPAREEALQRPQRSISLFPGHAYYSLAQRRYADLFEWLPGRSTSVEVPWHDAPLLAHELRAIARWYVLRAVARFSNPTSRPPAG